MKTYTDESWMPFGKYGPEQGDHRRLSDLPASYLLWLWESAEFWNKEKFKAQLARAQQTQSPPLIENAEMRLAMHDYIGNVSRFKNLEADASDVIVRHRPE